MVAELLDPLKAIKVDAGGTFDIITIGWKVPRELGDDLPFRLRCEDEPPECPSEVGGYERPALPAVW